MIYLRELTGASVIIGPFVDSTDGFTAETALVLTKGTIRVAKNGGAFAAKSASDTAVHKENGYYGFNVDTVDTNTPGALVLCAVTTGALPVWFDVMVLASPVYDSLILGTDKLQVDVQEMLAGVVTSTVIAANAIGASQIADGAIDSASFAAGALANAAFGTGAISATKFAAGAIDAAAIAADAIGASELAADAVAEIADAIWDELQSGHTGAGSFGKYVDAQLSVIAAYIDTEVAAIKAKTDQLTFTAANKVDATADLSTQGKADVNAEVVDALATDTNAELAALPGASPTIVQIMLFLYEIARNKLTTTATEQKIYKDNGTSVLGTWAVSDDGTTFTKAEVV